MFRCFSLDNICRGMVSSVFAGALFTFILIYAEALPAIGGMIGVQTVLAGFLVHFLMTLLVGAIFAVVFGCIIRGCFSGIALGLVTGVILWVLGPLTLLPYLTAGEPLNALWTTTGVESLLPMLGGHLVYGFFLGLVYGWLVKR